MSNRVYTITRSFSFSAAHTLRSDSLSAEENAQIYGKCSNAAGHGHDYTVEVRVSGSRLNEEVVFDRGRLEDLQRQVLAPKLAYQNLNASFGTGFIPTGENIAHAIWEMLRPHIPAHLRLTVGLVETRKNTFECSGT